MPDLTPKIWYYPATRVDAVVEDYHDTPVADPYRWLEDLQAPETCAWIEAQQRLTRSFLGTLPSRDPIKTRLTALWNVPRSSVPRRHPVCLVEK
jgi:prolyl oligopeptidase